MKYGRLTVLEQFPQLWRCRCDCGKIVDKQPEYVTFAPEVSSCGCLMREAGERIRGKRKQHTEAEAAAIQERKQRRAAAALMRKSERLAERQEHLAKRQAKLEGKLVRRLERVKHCTLRRQYPRLYTTWFAMHTRCYNRLDYGFARYGARGIGVCERWHRNDAAGFAHFVADMGDRPKGMSIDRIDNNGHYSPENCTWADYKTQGRNRGY